MKDQKKRKKLQATKAENTLLTHPELLGAFSLGSFQRPLYLYLKKETPAYKLQVCVYPR